VTHCEFHPVKGSGHRIGDIVYMDELVGRRRIRLAGVLGRILDPLFRVYLSKKFTQALDDHVRAEFPKLETLLHRGAPWRG
jgi:hypothetical protein